VQEFTNYLKMAKELNDALLQEFEQREEKMEALENENQKTNNIIN
jgi:hypothetical protein